MENNENEKKNAVVCRTYCHGHEQKVKKILDKTILEKGLESAFGRIVIPVENLVRVRKGKKVIEERRLYPGILS